MLIRLKRQPAGLYCFLLLIVGFTAFCNYKYILYAVQVPFYFITLIWMARNNKKILTSRYFVWYGLFAVWCTLSLLWAQSLPYAGKSVISIWQTVIYCTGVTFFINKEEKIDFALKCFYFASIVLIICLMAETSRSEMNDILHGVYNASSSKGRLGYSVGLFPNALGEICVTFSIIAYYFYSISKAKKHLLMIAVYIVIIFLTKSRASLLFLVFGIFLYSYFNAKRARKPIVLACVGITFLAAMYLVLNVPFLYNIVGFRMAGLLGLSGSGSYIADASTLGRLKLLRNGYKVFVSSPFLGVGINNCGLVSHLKYGYYTVVYAHNNYIELLADVGIVGAFLYYGLLYKSSFRAYKIMNKLRETEKRRIALLLTLLIYRLIADFFGVSYVEDFIQIMYALCIAGIQIYVKKMMEAGTVKAGAAYLKS